MRLNLALAALAASAAVASPAFAQTVTASATAEARGLVLQPLTLTRVDNLDFGTVISTAAAGQVTINEDDGSRTVSGGTLPGPATGNRALFAGAGTIGQQVDLTLTPPVGSLLFSGGNSINISNFTLDGGVGLTDTRTIDATGTFQVGVGGTFDIAANQANGLYAADFDLTAEYQ
jgi:hypothetical protein